MATKDHEGLWRGGVPKSRGISFRGMLPVQPKRRIEQVQHLWMWGESVKRGYGRADADGGWWMADGGWRMANGGWGLKKKWDVDTVKFIS